MSRPATTRSPAAQRFPAEVKETMFLERSKWSPPMGGTLESKSKGSQGNDYNSLQPSGPPRFENSPYRDVVDDDP